MTQLIEPMAFQQLSPDQRSRVARGQAHLAMPNALAFFCLYFFLPFLTWLSAEPAALLDALLVRLSRSVFDAAVAAFLPVCLDFAMSVFSRIGTEARRSIEGLCR